MCDARWSLAPASSSSTQQAELPGHRTSLPGSPACCGRLGHVDTAPCKRLPRECPQRSSRWLPAHWASPPAQGTGGTSLPELAAPSTGRSLLVVCVAEDVTQGSLQCRLPIQEHPPHPASLLHLLLTPSVPAPIWLLCGPCRSWGQ